MEKRCFLCGSGFALGDMFFSLGGRHICTDCADGATTDDLLLLTGAATPRGMLTALGFERDFI